MKVKNIFFVLLFLLPLIGTQAENFTGSLLWKISGNGLEKPSYIMGTHHLAPLDLLDNRPQIMEKLNEAEQIIGEMLMHTKNEIQQEIVQYIILPDSISYNELLSEVECQELDSLLNQHLGAGLSQLGRLKPNMLSLMYVMEAYSIATEVDFSTHIALDDHFQREGASLGKKVIGLETLKEQMTILIDATPLKEQAQTLLCTLKQDDTTLSQIEEMFELFRNEDIDALYKLFNSPTDECEFSKESKDALNKTRNNNWLTKLPELIAKHSSFIAVGCLHLAGEDGLLYQLNKMGYTVTAVK